MKKLLVIGAGFLQNFVIKKAKLMGYQVLAIDANPHAVGFESADKYAVIDIVNQEECLKYAQAEQIDGVLTAATDYGVLTASYIAEKMNLPGLNYAVAQLIKNKYLVRKCLFENSVDDTEQAYEIDINTDIDVLATKLDYPVMVKPCDGSGSRGASRVNQAKDLKEACQHAMEASITHRAEVESFIFGNEYGVESLVVNGEIHVIAVMKKWMTKPPYYAELGHAIPCGLPKEIEERTKKCVRDALVALGVNHGSVNMDLLITSAGKVHIIDIGARMGGNLIGSHIIPNGTGIDYMGNMIKAAVGDETDFTPEKSKSVATRLLAFKGGKVIALPDFESLQKEYGVEIEQHISIGDYVNEYHTNLDGCGYVVATSDDIEVAISKAETVKALIEKSIFKG